ncbi:MAG: phage tail tape measure protein, partial [Dethiobacteria bacterium]
WNIVASFINFLGNVFRNPIVAIKALFYDLASTIIGYIATIARGIETLLNKIPGVTVDITSGLDNLQKSLEKASLSVRSEGELVEYVKRKDFLDYSEGFTRGSKIGRDISTTFEDALSKFVDPLADAFDLSEFGTGSNPLHVTSGDKLKVDMSEEDLKYLRDLAQREYVNKFSTATLAPNIQISFGDIHETADADKVAKRIRKILQEEIAMAAEGSYA